MAIIFVPNVHIPDIGWPCLLLFITIYRYSLEYGW